MMRTIIRWKDPQDFLHTKTKSIIAGDIGGTKSWLVWFAQAPHQAARVLFERCYESAKFSSVSALMQTFMAEAGRTTPPGILCLGLPGPVDLGRVALTNLDWIADAEMLKKELGIPEVRFINDFQAAAAGVATLKKTDYEILNAGLVRMGATRVITGAGTGLGLAWMEADKLGEYHTYSTEGGHIDFAPANQQQCDLLNWLASTETSTTAHVSWERILSGMGLRSLYKFHQSTGKESDTLVPANASSIHAAALRQEPVALAAVQMFADIYAAWVGNLVLLYQPRGGLYIAGGIAIHLQSWLKAERFMQIVTDKGRMAELVRQTPIYLITNSRLGVQGAMKLANS